MRLQNSIFKYVILVALWCSPTFIISQSSINKTSAERAALGITKSKGYNFVIIDGALTTDSILSVVRKFNTKGYRTETAVYKLGVLSTTYQFEYENDTLLVKMKTLKGTKKTVISESGFEYDKHYNLKKQYSLLDNKKQDLITKQKYNKKGQLVRSRLGSKRQQLRDDRFKYDDNGNLSEKIEIIPAKE